MLKEKEREEKHVGVQSGVPKVFSTYHLIYGGFRVGKRSGLGM